MSYPFKHGLGYLIRKSNAHDTAENVAASPAVYGGYLVAKPCSISEFKFYVTVAVVGTSAVPVVEVNQRPTYNSSSGEILIDQITIPNGTAAGKVLSTRFAPVQLNVGDELSFEHVTQAAGSPAGEGFYDAILEADFEADGNQSNHITSA